MRRDLLKELRNILGDKGRMDLPWVIINHLQRNPLLMVDMGEDKMNRLSTIMRQHGVSGDIVSNLQQHFPEWVGFPFRNRDTGEELYDIEFDWIPHHWGAKLLMTATIQAKTEHEVSPP
jgi:hypothetical protein